MWEFTATYKRGGSCNTYMGEHGGARYPAGGALTTRVVEEIADREGVDPLELSPRLNTVIDGDAVEALFAGESGDQVELEFTYADHRVTVVGAEEVRIETE